MSPRHMALVPFIAPLVDHFQKTHFREAEFTPSQLSRRLTYMRGQLCAFKGLTTVALVVTYAVIALALLCMMGPAAGRGNTQIFIT